MNYNDKKKADMEIDDMKIKSHLNASLDMSGISVSEDLINRTLEAIKKQPAERQADVTAEENKKKPSERSILWSRYIRGFAGVAAAALILVAGYGLISGSLSGKSKMDSTNALPESTEYNAAASDADKENSAFSTAQDTAQAEDAMEEKDTDGGADAGATGESAVGAANGATDDSVDVQSVPQFTIAADTILSAEDEDIAGLAGQTTPEEARMAGEQPASQNTGRAPLLTFRDIFLPDPEQAQSLTITEEISATSVTLTSQEEILDFYAVMDKHQFTGSTDASAGTNYKVEIKSLQPGEAQYTMSVGGNITVSYQDNAATSQSIYNADDSALLIQNLQDFFNKYTKQ
jgi:hypothetical protein